MKWEMYLRQLVQSSELSSLQLTIDGEKASVPPIVRASIMLLDKMLENNSQYNVFVFPEKEQTIFLFAIMKLFHNISSGRVVHHYDPSSFVPGEKLRLGKAVFEFVSFGENEFGECIKLKFAPGKKGNGPEFYTAPIGIVPALQHTDTPKSLSRYDVFSEEVRKRKTMHTGEAAPDLLKELDAHITHMENSVFFMSTIAGVREQFSSTAIQGRKITDLLLVSHANYRGELQSLSTRKVSGVPAFILASDLDSIRTAIDKGASAQSLILDISDSSRILNRLDVLDELMDLHIPILCATDTANSFELDDLIRRGFRVWRWDITTLTPDLYDVTDLASDKRIRFCARQCISYLVAPGSEIKEVLTVISRHRKESEEQSAAFLKLFGKLTGLAFDVLHQVIPFRPPELELANTQLDDCEQLLAGEKGYINQTLYDDMQTAIIQLRSIFSPSFRLTKIDKLENWLISQRQMKICMIVANGTNKLLVHDYWQRICLRRRSGSEINVFYPDEYLKHQFSRYNLTIVTGWLRSSSMRKILHSYKTERYTVLLYSNEQRWQKSLVSKWTRQSQQKDNDSIIHNYLSTDSAAIAVPEHATEFPDDVGQDDELTEIERTVQENKIRQYTGNRAGAARQEMLQAYPVSFVGGYLAFYRISHKLLSATKIILEGSEKIQTVLPRDIHEGDFIVIREANKDIITELADIELKKQGKSNLRSVAKKWQDVLRLELIFSDAEELYTKMKEAGCTVSEGTFRNWLEDEDMIAPQSPDDLRLIAKVCENPMMEEMIDEIHYAACEVRAAHTQAGVSLSRLLKKRIAQELQTLGEIDAINIWEPIDMEVEGIGKVKVLKVIDIEPALMIDASNTNRLLSE